jgi:glycosyltransferase involved in cell wall biosynthesis
VFAVPGDLSTPTGGYAYDRRMVEELRALGWQVEVADLGDEFPAPSERSLADARRILAKIDPQIPVVIDGLAFGVLDAVAQDLKTSHRMIALVHHPLALESGLSAPRAAALRASERKALACARHVIVTSPATARLLSSDYDVAAERITVARPGNDPVALSRGSNDGTIALLAVGSLVPRKGHDVLIAALAQLADLPWFLTIVGDRSRDPDFARRIGGEIERAGLAARIRMAGVVSAGELAQLYDQADLFVLPSHYEGYGMAFADAIAHGVAVVACDAGAIAETVPPRAGRLVPPGDRHALASTLRELIVNRNARDDLRAGARDAARSLPSWRASAQSFVSAVEMVS